jgi:hypothetical protein
MAAPSLSLPPLPSLSGDLLDFGDLLPELNSKQQWQPVRYTVALAAAS